MSRSNDVQNSETYLTTLCSIGRNRRLGSPANRAAIGYVADILGSFGWNPEQAPFPCMDYASGCCKIACNGRSFEVVPSLYSPGCDASGELVVVTTIEELERCSCTGRVLLLIGDIAAEKLMPKKYVFYNPDRHKRINALLEGKQPAAVIAATKKNPALAGALDPFPMIEDGDLDIPVFYCRDAVGLEMARHRDSHFSVRLDARRIPAEGWNVVGRKNPGAPEKIVVCAHVDTHELTPGALDNASGVVVLMLLAEKLADYHGPLGVELVAVNGEDHYTAAGELDYLQRYGAALPSVRIGINIDGAGYRDGGTAYSLYGCDESLRKLVAGTLGSCPGIAEGPIWYQGDHMIFVQQGCPAIAVTSEKAQELVSTVVHTSLDTPDLVDCEKLVEIAEGLERLVRAA